MRNLPYQKQTIEQLNLKQTREVLIICLAPLEPIETKLRNPRLSFIVPAQSAVTWNPMTHKHVIIGKSNINFAAIGHYFLS